MAASPTLPIGLEVRYQPALAPPSLPLSSTLVAPSTCENRPETAVQKTLRCQLAPKQDGCHSPFSLPNVKPSLPGLMPLPGCPHLVWLLRSCLVMVSKPTLTGQVPGGAVQDAATPARPSPPPRPRRRRRRRRRWRLEPGCGAGRQAREGEQRGWIQHGGAEPEPRVRRRGGRSGEGESSGTGRGRAGPRRAWGRKVKGEAVATSSLRTSREGGDGTLRGGGGEEPRGACRGDGNCGRGQGSRRGSASMGRGVNKGPGWARPGVLKRPRWGVGLRSGA